MKNIIRLRRGKNVSQNTKIEPYYCNYIRDSATRSQKKHVKNKIRASSKIINYFLK